jgi:hypothetical protein
MLLNDFLNFAQPMRREASLHCQFRFRLQPELRVAVITCDVHVHPILFQ